MNTQPEEWEKELKKRFFVKGTVFKAEDFIDFIENEIRNAEEKAYNQAIIDVIKVIPNDPEAESDRWNFASIGGAPSFQGYKIGFREGFNCWKEEFISVVEALKK